MQVTELYGIDIASTQTLYKVLIQASVLSRAHENMNINLDKVPRCDMTQEIADALNLAMERLISRKLSVKNRPRQSSPI